ncbi:MAG TPA: HAMP domain-containing sensor histidine kinase, partial [Dehalococcoidia bacterium]|nr:HAMP domain-containing sensor histidine kinase [Dehalococcoidia bacterium]
TVINELLDVASLQMGRPLDLDRQPTDLVALVSQAVADAQHAVDCPALRVEADAPQVVGEWDAARLERVVANLLSNAIKYSPAGGEIMLTVGMDLDDTGTAWATFSVQDRGIGIPAKDVPRIFERFHRGGNVVGRIAGTGIGLAGSRQIVEQHGGTISVQSREGEGSTFTVRLPLSSEKMPVTQRR